MLYRLLFILTIAVTSSTAQPCAELPWDAHVTYQLNTIESSLVRSSSGVASDALLPLSIGTPVALYAFGVWGGSTTENNRYSAQSGVLVGLTMGATYAAVIGLKAVFARQRPYQAHPDCITNYRSDSDGSMPSGHSAGAAALATAVSLRYPYWYVIAPAATYAVWTGFSRMNLGMHYLTDVLAGYALGIGMAVLVHVLRNEIFDVSAPLIPSDDQASLLLFPTTELVSLSLRF